MAQNIQPFDDFLKRMVQENKLPLTQLTEMVGLETANRLQDNSNNLMGAPSLGSGTGKVLHGQLHEFTGSIADIKGRIADKLEEKMTPDEPDSPKSKNPAPPTPNNRFGG